MNLFEFCLKLNNFGKTSWIETTATFTGKRNKAVSRTKVGYRELDYYEYEITYLVSNAKKTEISSKEGEAGITTYSGIGDTIQEAINDVKLKMPFQPYNGHLLVTIISEEKAQRK